MILATNRLLGELKQREIVHVQDAAGARIDCLRGRIWITEDRTPGDVVLEAGESHLLSPRAGVVVQALRESRIALRAPALSPAESALAAGLRRLRERWAGRPTVRGPAQAARAS